MQTGHKDRGGALLAVLWLSAALTAIVFSVANTVRAEAERTSTAVDGTRAYYLATGGLERAVFYIELGASYRNPDGSPKYFEPGMPRLHFEFPGGVADVEIIPEASKMSVNESKPEELARLATVLGAHPAQAQQVAAAIVDWRSPAPGGLSLFDQMYMAGVPSFRARHASVEEIEELLLVKGMTPDLFYGNVVRDAEGRLQPRAGLRDCLSVYGSPGAVDVNTAEPAVLVTVGVPPQTVAAIVGRRRALPFKSMEEVVAFTQGALGSSAGRLMTGGGTIFTLRSTGRMRVQHGVLSDMGRTVRALMKFHRTPNNPPIETLRWYDN